MEVLLWFGAVSASTDSQPRNAVKANMNRENTHNGTASVMDWPSQSPDLNILLRPKSKVEL